ncbi:MAG TPA: cupin domain-containing protein [Kofleriaceae bacterium]|nr:cupin domain-containing protein [Kofleriaceae bacterium]
MTTWTMRIGCALLALGAVANADVTKKTDATKTKKEATTHKHEMNKPDTVFINASDIKFGAAPPDLPKGGELAVLFGDPMKPGQFTVRFKMPDGYKIPPHWHTQDENLTILSGTLLLYMGDTMTGEPHSLNVGGYHFLPGKAHHAAQAKGEVIVQIHGPGPFDIHYLNPADNPNPKTARR